jgi:hypothetical protein
MNRILAATALSIDHGCSLAQMCLQNHNHPHFVLTEIPAMASRFSLQVESILHDVIIHVPVVPKLFLAT